MGIWVGFFYEGRSVDSLLVSYVFEVYAQRDSYQVDANQISTIIIL